MPTAIEGLGATVTLYNSNVALVCCVDAMPVGDEDVDVLLGCVDVMIVGDEDVEVLLGGRDCEERDGEASLIPEDIDGASDAAGDGEVRPDVDVSNVDVADASDVDVADASNVDVVDAPNVDVVDAPAVPATVGWLVEILVTDAGVG